MRGPESGAWDDMRTEIKRIFPRAHLSRVENAVGDGTPDVNGCIEGLDFWVELKGLRAWINGEGIVHLGHELRESQALWAKARSLAGGLSWVMLGIRSKPPEWLIWDGPTAARVLDVSTRATLIDTASLHSIGPFPARAFRDLLSDRRNFAL